MTAAPAFFIPDVPSEKLEEVYAAYAQMCYQDTPALGRRIYSITFAHDGTVWTATVGEPLRGTKTTTHRSKGQQHERRTEVSDPAIVLAIFPGTPYLVVTNHWRNAPVGSGWVNPFMAGQPRDVGYFAHE